MTIPIVCECGFRQEVPNEWEGMRVQCKCGRSFVISEDGCILEPPVAVAPQQPDQRQFAKPTTTAQAGASPTLDRWGFSADRVDKSVAARYRLRHNLSDARRRIILGGGALIALLCLGALAVVLPQHLPFGWQIRTQATADPASPPPAAAREPVINTHTQTRVMTAESAANPTSSGKLLAAPESVGEMVVRLPRDSSDPPANDLSDVTDRLKSRMAELIELEADDGLLLTGMFGQEYRQLEITEQQQVQIEELVQQLKTQEEELGSRAIELEQWYSDGENIGIQLLAVLTDAQRSRLRQLIQNEQITRVPIEEYAARLRPELRIFPVSWKIEPDSVRPPGFASCDFSGPAQEGWYRPQAASGVFAVARVSPTQSGANEYQVHSLVANQVIGKCVIPQRNIGHTTLVSPEGEYLVVGRRTEEGVPVAEVWSTRSGTMVASKELPSQGERSAEPRYVLRDCIADQLFAISDSGYWVWNFVSDQARTVQFPDWIPNQGVPVSAMSPGGRYVVVAHRHAPVVQSRRYHFVEVGIYELETGDLLGNQVLATDYQEMSMTAIEFSYDGRELALLWDVSSPEPQRVLTHMDGINGKVIRTVDGLLPGTEGYARQHDLDQRDLICLPDNSGWIVNLQQLVESESGALIDIELPKLQRSSDAAMRDPEAIVEAIPAGDGRLLLVIIQHTGDANTTLQLKCQFIDLPEMGPFM